MPTEEDITGLIESALLNPLPPPWSFGGETQVGGEISDDEDVIRPRKLDYVVSKKGKSKVATRRLHRVGYCWRWPGVDYTIHGWYPSHEEPPFQGDDYDVLCKQCWPGYEVSGSQRKRPRTEEDERIVDDSSSASSSDSSVMSVQSEEGDEEVHSKAE